MKRTGNILILLLITIIATSCDGGDRDRIPAAAVRVEFANQAMWDLYGVSGSFIHRRFIRNQKIPAGFPTGGIGTMMVPIRPEAGTGSGSSAYFGIYTLGRYISFASNN